METTAAKSGRDVFDAGHPILSMKPLRAQVRSEVTCIISSPIRCITPGKPSLMFRSVCFGFKDSLLEERSEEGKITIMRLHKKRCRN